MIKNVSIGSDAEVIVQDLSNRPFPICGMVGGTKDKPRKIPDTPYFIQEDNVLLEFNIPPCTTQAEFKKHMTQALNSALTQLPPSLKLYKASTAIFDRNLIAFGQAYMFGCDPDFNAWTMEENPKPTAANKELRSAAGHIHIGWDNPTNEDRIALIKACDIFAGLRSVIQFTDRTRRELYGKAGSFRPKEYGVEHRVLDNEWVFNSYANAIYDWYHEAINFVNAGLVSQITKEDEELIQKSINTYDYRNCEKLVNKYGKLLYGKAPNLDTGNDILNTLYYHSFTKGNKKKVG